MYQSSDGDYFAVFCHRATPDFSNLIHNMPKTLQELLYPLKNGNTIITWLEDIVSIIRIPKLYKAYFGQSKNKLLAYKILINIAIPKQRADGLPIKHMTCGLLFLTKH